MTCCEHCPERKSAEESEDAAFEKAVRALRAIQARRPLVRTRGSRNTGPVVVNYNTTFRYLHPAVIPPSTPDPDRPRG